jgi:hypothetical protein
LAKYTVGKEVLKLLLEGKARLVRGKKLKYGRYRILRRYLVKGVVHGCKSEGESVERG